MAKLPGFRHRDTAIPLSSLALDTVSIHLKLCYTHGREKDVSVSDFPNQATNESSWADTRRVPLALQ